MCSNQNRDLRTGVSHQFAHIITCLHNGVPLSHVLFFMGPTGFDSNTFGEVSMSGVGKIIRNQTFQTTTGEEHFAMAA